MKRDSMGVSYRLASEEDVASVSAVFAESHDDLLRRHGLFETPIRPDPPPPIFGFLIRKTPGAFWVAEDGGRVVGFSDSFVRGSFWYFSWLFVSPSHQGMDIGRNLLERTLESWRGVGITNRATITFSYNPASQSLYMRYGMYSREPLYYVKGPASAVRESGRREDPLDFGAAASLEEAAPVLKEMDGAALGFSLEWHHEYFFETRSRCYLFREGGEPVGYAYVRPSGGIGPMAVSSSRFIEPVLETALALAAGQPVENVAYWTPGSNVHAVGLALKHRMRFEPYVLMSTKPFAKWENYLFNSAALM